MLTAEVIVDVRAWGLNRPLTYEIPESLAGRVSIGSVVRVPLQNRRVRGWVVSVSDARDAQADLSQLASVSGRGPVFDPPLLSAMRNLARRYVHPLVEFLSLLTPQRLGRPTAKPAVGPQFADSKADATLLRLGPLDDPVQLYAELVGPIIEKGEAAIVCAPEVAEGSRVLEGLAERFPDDAAVVHSGIDPAARSAALWAASEGKLRLILGGRAALFAPRIGPGLIVIHQEHDRSYKEQRTPYYDAREVARVRTDAMGGSLILSSATPSAETVFGEEKTHQPGARAIRRAEWPAVELVEPTRASVPRRAVAAIIEARARRERTLVLLPRVHSSQAGPGPEHVVNYLSKVVPAASIGRADRPGLGEEPGRLREVLESDVVVATEAGLADVPRPRVAVAIGLGIDAYLYRPSGRANEESFASLWALGSLAAGRAPRGRLILETENQEHYLVQALTRGDPAYFVRFELENRREMDLPPFVTLARLQVRGAVPKELIESLRALPGVQVLGPAPGGRLGEEILLKIADLEPVLDPLGTIVEASKARILVEMDPRQW